MGSWVRRSIIAGLSLCAVAAGCDAENARPGGAAAPNEADEPEIGVAAGPDELAVPDRLSSSRDGIADFIKICAAGDGPACNELGKYYLERPGATKTAIQSFAKACEAGSQEGCNNQAVMELRRAPKDKRVLEGAAERLQKACDGNEAVACANLALVLQDRMKGAEARAAAAAKKGCDGGFGRSCVLLARARLAGKSADATAARRVLEEACAAERVAACRLLGQPVPEGAGGFAELEAGKDPFACSADEWLARVAEAMKLTSFVRDQEALPAKADCDLWTIR